MIRDLLCIYQSVTRRSNYPISVWCEDFCLPAKSWVSHHQMTYSYGSVISLIQNGSLYVRISDICYLLAGSGQIVHLMCMLGFLNQISLEYHSIWMPDGMLILISVCLYFLSDQSTKVNPQGKCFYKDTSFMFFCFFFLEGGQEGGQRGGR